VPSNKNTNKSTNKQQKKKQTIDKVILQGISGFAKPGQVLAILGPSGSGKSSLLTVLSGSIPKLSNLEGTVTANGKPLGKNFTKRVAGFVHQDDLLFKQQTVHETLKFSARLRLPNEMSQAEKDQRVEDVISQMGLRKCRDTPIGGEFC
jgi:ATP-binding cassette, subfamily G (WHITE), member 2